MFSIDHTRETKDIGRIWMFWWKQSETSEEGIKKYTFERKTIINTIQKEEKGTY